MIKETSFYFIIPAAFAVAMCGRQSAINGRSYFGYTYTKDCTCVTSINSANDFPEAFDSLANTMPDSSLVVVPLGINDFPPSPEIK